MTSDALVVSRGTFKTLTAACQSELLEALGLKPLSSPLPTSEDDPDAPTAFSLSQMRDFLDGVSGKTRTFLKELAKQPAEFNVGKLLKALKLQYGDIRGILAGLTKRSRTISGDQEASFFQSVAWFNEDIGRCVSRIHPTTHASLQKLLLAD
jgi:hypothetical protein